MRIELPQLDNLTENEITEMAKQIQANPCGSCTECCYAIAIEELGKPYFRHCQHQGKASCRIHETKPRSCKHYLCGYALGLFGVGDEALKYRPDNLGFVFHIVRQPAGQTAPDSPEMFILEIIESGDQPFNKWKLMNIPLNTMLNLNVRPDAIKFFLYDTEIPTTFHTDAKRYGWDSWTDDDCKSDWKVMHALGMPPLLFWSRTRNRSTLAKLASIMAGYGNVGVLSGGLDRLKEVLKL